jgi:hypothetical protein
MISALEAFDGDSSRSTSTSATDCIFIREKISPNIDSQSGQKEE